MTEQLFAVERGAPTFALKFLVALRNRVVKPIRRSLLWEKHHGSAGVSIPTALHELIPSGYVPGF